MPSTTPAEAAKAFADVIQDALSCFATCKVLYNTKAGLITVKGAETLADARAIALNGSGNASFLMEIRYATVNIGTPASPGYEVSTRGWIYHLFSSEGEDLFGYHWHPLDDSHAVWPHLHINGGRKHYPTGRILLEDVLQLSSEFGVEPLDGEKWRKISRDNRERFASESHWHNWTPAM